MMKSDESEMLGRILRSARIVALYSSAVCPRFIAIRMRSEPLARAGADGLPARGFRRQATMASVNSTGCDVV